MDGSAFVLPAAGSFALPAAGSFAQMGSDEETVQQAPHPVMPIQLPLSSPLASPRAISDEPQQQASPPPPTVPALTADELEAVRKVVGPTASVSSSDLALRRDLLCSIPASDSSSLALCLPACAGAGIRRGEAVSVSLDLE